MASTYKTPGVYVEEISVFPPAIAQVETAVPAFIGHTARALYKGQSLANKPRRLTSLAEFEDIFGGAPPSAVKSLKLDDKGAVTDIVLEKHFHLYESMRLFFANGGSQCWIVSVGSYDDKLETASFLKGLDAVKGEDEPTLLVFPDAVLLADGPFNVQTAALRQAADLMDRFCILDLKPAAESPAHDEIVDEFRNKIGINNLSYGAAYTPHLVSGFERKVSYRAVQGKDVGGGKLLNVTDPVFTGTDPQIVLAAQLLNKAVADRNDFDKAVKDSLANKTFEAAYKEKQTAFAAALTAAQSAPDAAKVTALRTVAVEMVDLSYKTLADLAAKPLKNTDVLKTPAPPAAANAPMLQAEIRALVAKGGRLNALLARLNAITVTEGRAGGGTAGAAADELQDRYKKQRTPFIEADWGDVSKDGIAAPGFYTDLTPEVVPADASNAAKRAGEMRDNLVVVERKLQELWQDLTKEIQQLQRAAAEVETTFESTTLDRMPAMRQLMARVAEKMSLVPPSGAVAGVFCATDGRLGVHHAPANASLEFVSGLGVRISHDAQKSLNVDPVAGKSINAIRPFTGKGILVWGARTLAGNDNEWRYVSVRRFFNMVEESAKKATEAFVFKPNDANTWTRVKAMIESFLQVQWRAGALAGATAEQAFLVKVGLGQTMTPDDVLNGIMIVEIAMAVVRPSEFIVLRFSHKMQES